MAYVRQHFVTFEANALKYFFSAISHLRAIIRRPASVPPALSKTLYPLDKETNAAFSLGSVYSPGSVHMAPSESSCFVS